MFPKIPFPFDLLLTISAILGGLALLNYSFGIYELAKLYKTDQRYSEEVARKGKPCRCRISKDTSGSIKGITIAFLETGIYIDSGFISLSILEIISPKLLIPWSEISRYEVAQDRKHYFYLGNPMITILTLDTQEVRELENLSGISVSDRLNKEQ